MPALTIHYPSGYSKFSCIGSRCPMTCCAGWRITIDKPAARIYRREGGRFGRRLKMAVDWKELRFKSDNGHCPMLGRDKLCDIYKHMGAEKMCRTCRIYPRHMEDYGTLHEAVLLLSCPEAVRLILLAPEPLKIISAKRYRSCLNVDGVDLQFLKSILRIRGHMFHILYSGELPLYRRLAAVLTLGHDIGRCAGNEKRAVNLARHYERWVYTSNFEERLTWVFHTIPPRFDSAKMS